MGVQAALFSMDGSSLYTAGSDYSITEWDVETGRLARRISQVAGSISDMTFFASDEKVAMVDESRIKILRTVTGEILLDLVKTNGLSVAVTLDEKRLITGGHFEDSVVELWDVATGSVINRANDSPWNTPLTGIELSPDGRQFAGTRDNRYMQLWNAETLERVRDLYNSTGHVATSGFYAGGREHYLHRRCGLHSLVADERWTGD